MSETKYKIIFRGEGIARDMNVTYACMLAQAIIDNTWAEPDLQVTIARQFGDD